MHIGKHTHSLEQCQLSLDVFMDSYVRHQGGVTGHNQQQGQSCRVCTTPDTAGRQTDWTFGDCLQRLVQEGHLSSMNEKKQGAT